MTLRLGVIGLSPGNGHPYSWSAIFNGYVPDSMENCGFPVIPRYLERQQFPRDAIPVAKVTHVWAQDPKVARHISEATRIPHVVDRYEDLIGQVDAVLLARDDAETHLGFATPFLKAGVPIYIDKPLALTRDIARALIDLQCYPGQLFSCSALRYAKELTITAQQREALGEIRYVHAVVPKDWNKYAIHVIDPVLEMLGHEGVCSNLSAVRMGEGTMLQAVHYSGVHLHLAALGNVCTPIDISVIGTRASYKYRFEDTFNAFKSALNEFVEGVIQRDVRSSPQRLLAAVDLVEAGGRA